MGGDEINAVVSFLSGLGIFVRKTSAISIKVVMLFRLPVDKYRDTAFLAAAGLSAHGCCCSGVGLES